jgi:RimJ/RimL family protein N-acetyltransferase
MNLQTEFPPIETPRLYLRLLAPDDIPALLAYRQLPEVMQYLSKRPVLAETVLEEIEATRLVPVGTPGYRVRTVIVPKASPIVVGDTILKIIEDEPQQGELGYALHPAYQGKGYATEALRAMARYAFEVLQLHRITATIFAEHTPSIKVAERIGMQREAYFRQAVWRDGKWVDDAVYAILREDWEAMAHPYK